MPMLNVGFVTSDALLADTFDVLRRENVVSDLGRVTASGEQLFEAVLGTVTQQDPADILRTEDGQNIPKRILVCAQFQFVAEAKGLQPDEVTWDGVVYTVVSSMPYRRFGDGHYQAVCEFRGAVPAGAPVTAALVTSGTDAPGYLLPIGPQVPYDDDLLDLLQPAVVGVGGWPDPKLVRPWTQVPDVPNQPEQTDNWCAMRATNYRADTYQHEAHVDDGAAGYDEFEYAEAFDLMLSCYGPLSQAFASLMRDGFRLAQNRQPLQAMKMDVQSVGDPVVLPSLLHGTWQRRVDVTVHMTRVVDRRYGVRTLVLPPDPARSGLDNELYVTPIDVPVPADD